MSDWKNRPLDPSFLVDSGLLFEINKTTLHPIGMALVVASDPKTGQSRLILKDNRANPELAVYDTAVWELGQEKLRAFMETYGGSQLDKRRQKLGWGVQFTCGKAK